MRVSFSEGGVTMKGEAKERMRQRETETERDLKMLQALKMEEGAVSQ